MSSLFCKRKAAVLEGPAQRRVVSLSRLSVTQHTHTPRTLTERHECFAGPVVVPSAAMFPHVGVVGLRVLVLNPSRRSRDGDNVENNGEEQE